MSIDDAFGQLTPKLQSVSLQVYVSTFCFDCTRLKRLLDAHGIAYETVNISSVAGAAERLERETGKRGVPYVLVNGQHWVRGYHLEQPGRLNPELFVIELASALK
ncbi:MAG: glutaredoxin family protein [Planctomycetes bacterium]|nr:glutaredoxin family protein [Planctomycetota bacterium]